VQSGALRHGQQPVAFPDRPDIPRGKEIEVEAMARRVEGAVPVGRQAGQGVGKPLPG
jgi:hypothetical protein